MALLEADVNFKVARDFIDRVKAKSLGQEVIQSIAPGQQIVENHPRRARGSACSEHVSLELKGSPACIMLVGLHGSGKTTSSAKLARLIQKQGRQPPSCRADVYRPAAMDQLDTLGKQLPSARVPQAR
jgi:signal recognition particle subunit SRP54